MQLEAGTKGLSFRKDCILENLVDDAGGNHQIRFRKTPLFKYLLSENE